MQTSTRKLERSDAMNFIRQYDQKRFDCQIEVLTLTLLLAMFSGCEKRQGATSEDTFKVAHELMSGYFDGDIATARQSLENSIKTIEDSTVSLFPPGRAAFLSIQYARLYAFERRFGSEADAEVALIKARYWHIMRFDLSLKHGLSVMNDRFRKEMMDYDPDKIVKMIESLDKANTQRKGPKFSR